METKPSCSDSSIGSEGTALNLSPKSIEVKSIGDVTVEKEDFLKKGSPPKGLAQVNDGLSMSGGDCAEESESFSKLLNELSALNISDEEDDDVTSTQVETGCDKPNLSGYEAEDEVDSFIVDWEQLSNQDTPKNEGNLDEVTGNVSAAWDDQELLFDEHADGIKKIIDDSLISESSESICSKGQPNELCETCCRRAQQMMKMMSEDDDKIDQNAAYTKLGSVMDAYCRYFNKDNADDYESKLTFENYGIEKLGCDPWCKPKLSGNKNPEGFRSFSESDGSIEDICKLIAMKDTDSMEDKCVQVSETENDASNEASYEEYESWKDKTSFEVISHISQTIQTDASYLQENVGVSNANDPIESTSSGKRIPFDEAVVADVENAANDEENFAVTSDPATKKSVEEISEDDDDDVVPDHLDKLLDSIQFAPPIRSRDGSNMWMVPAEDENGNCINVVYDDGESYDIFVFRAPGPSYSMSTQTEEKEFIEITVA